MRTREAPSLIISMTVTTRTSPKFESPPRDGVLKKPDWGWSPGPIVAAASIAPSLVAVESSLFGPKVMTLAITALLWVAVGVGAAFVGTRLGLTPRVSVLSGATFVAAVTIGGRLDSLPAGMTVLSSMGFALAILLGRIWSKRKKAWELLAKTAWITAVLMIAAATTSLWVGARSVAMPLSSRAVLAQGTPSFYLVIVDGYPGGFSELPALRPILGDFMNDLGQRGFEQTVNARANYNATYAAVSTAVSLDHELVVSRDGVRTAFQRIRGENRLAREMQQHGYRYVHVESGFLGSACGGTVDLCYPGLFFDETVEDLVDSSLIGSWWTQSAYTSGAIHSFESLTSHMVNDRGGDFVFAHILLPHPPLLLDRTCSPRYQKQTDVNVLHPPGATAEELDGIKSTYVEQIRCVNGLVLDLVDHLPRDARVVITGDHGTEFRGQLLKAPEEWDAGDIAERFSLFNVTRLPQGCDVSARSDLINIMRASVSCILGVDLDPIPESHSIVPYYDDLDLEPRLLTESDMDF